jgi:sugar-specific transcriptional regulator TrmB
MSKVKEAISNLTHEEKEQMHQYATSIKQIKKKMAEMLNKSRLSTEETGGNRSYGLVLQDK